MTNPNRTDIIIIQDRSGSMQSIKKDSEGGINSFLEGQKEVPGECYVTMVQFDNQYDELYQTRPLNMVENYTLEPRGMTALLDAIGTTVTNVGNRFAALPEDQRPGKVAVIINTDGFENASRKFNKHQINDMISRQRDVYKWEFIFLGANQDAIATGQDLGISRANSMTYSPTAGGVAASYGAVTDNVAGWRSGTLASASFNDTQRAEAVEDDGDTTTNTPTTDGSKLKPKSTSS